MDQHGLTSLLLVRKFMKAGTITTILKAKSLDIVTIDSLAQLMALVLLERFL
jgi:hypothetical protein